jgi:hypothetical protein
MAKMRANFTYLKFIIGILSKNYRIIAGYPRNFGKLNAPGASNTTAHTGADRKFAIRYVGRCIFDMPAVIGTIARAGPMKRPMTTLSAPQRWKNFSP